MKTHSIAKSFGLVLALAGAANAQDRNTIRPLGPVTARTAEPVGGGPRRQSATAVPPDSGFPAPLPFEANLVPRHVTFGHDFRSN